MELKMNFSNKYIAGLLISILSITTAFVCGNFIEPTSILLRALYAVIGGGVGAYVGIYLLKRLR
jgi:uncharacterized membrane protein YgaE (UPF0421/DUF939 family)